MSERERQLTTRANDGESVMPPALDAVEGPVSVHILLIFNLSF